MTAISSVKLKEIQRAELRAARARISSSERERRSSLIKQNFLKSVPYKDHSVVSGYVAIDGEVAVDDLLEELDLQDHQICLPKVVNNSDPLAFHQWVPGGVLEKGPFDTQEPISGQILLPQLVIVPLIGFNKQGARLGFGAGFYDRTIAELRSQAAPLCVGVAFACQERHDLPLEPHDERLDMVVTECDVFDFR